MNNEKEILELNDKELEEVNGGLSQEGIEWLAVDIDRDRDAVAFLNPCEDKMLWGRRLTLAITRAQHSDNRNRKTNWNEGGIIMKEKKIPEIKEEILNGTEMTDNELEQVTGGSVRVAAFAENKLLAVTELEEAVAAK